MTNQIGGRNTDMALSSKDGLPLVRGRQQRVMDVLLALTLVLVAVCGAVEIARGSEPYFNNDEPRHIMTAVFWCDFLRVKPMTDPIGFAYAYYGHYPAVAPLYWPPLAHMVTGLLFLVTGPSVAVARLFVLFVTLLVLVIQGKLVKGWLGSDVIVIAVLLLAASPAFEGFRSIFMLEMPCMLWMLLSVLFLGSFIRSNRSSYIWLCSGSVIAALLTKQHALGIVPAVVLGALVGFRKCHWHNWHTYAAAALAILIPGGYYAVAFSVTSSIWKHVVIPSGGSVATDLMGFFWGMGPLSVLLGVGGALVFLGRGRADWLRWASIVWIAGVFAVYLLPATRDARYLVYCAPALAILAANFFAFVNRRLPATLRWVAISAIVAVCWYQVVQSSNERMNGFEGAAIKANDLASNGIIVFGGYFDGPFILYRRLHDDALKTITFRADKLLGEGNILPHRGYTGFVGSPEGVRQVFEATGAEIAVIEDQPGIDAKEHRWFWDFVHGRGFQFVDSVRVTYHNARSGQVSFYRYLGPKGTWGKTTIPMLTLREGSLSFDPERSLLEWGRKQGTRR